MSLPFLMFFLYEFFGWLGEGAGDVLVYLYAVIYALLLVFMVGQFTKNLMYAQKTAVTIQRFWLAEYEMRLCAELKAFRLNVEDASKTLSTDYPQHIAEIKSAAEVLVAELYELYDFNESSLCRNVTLGLVVRPFRQQNPNIARYWPNWWIRFYDLQK